MLSRRPKIFAYVLQSVFALKATRQLLRRIPKGTYELGDNVGAVQVVKKGHGWGKMANDLVRQWNYESEGNVTNAWVSTLKMRADPLTRGGKVPGPAIPLSDWYHREQWTTVPKHGGESSIKKRTF